MATLKSWYPLTKDYKDYSGNSSDLELISGTWSLTEQPGLLGRAIAQTNIARTTTLKNEASGLKDNHAMFCFLKVTEFANTNTANGIFGCHNHSTSSGTGITLRPLNTSEYNLSVNTGSGNNRTHRSHYTNQTLSIGDWHHVGFTWDQDSNTLCFYVDGVLDKVVTGLPDMVMNPNDPLLLFIWSISIFNSASYRPAFAIQDVRTYDGVPSLAEIQNISKGLFFRLPLDSPCEGSLQTYTSWVTYTPYATTLESRHDYVKAVMELETLDTPQFTAYSRVLLRLARN